VKVAYVSPHAHIGGAERVTMELVAHHDRSVVEPALIFLSDGPLVAEARALGVSVEVHRAPRLRQVLAARSFCRTLAARLRALQVDLVHGVMAWGHAYAGPAARIAGRRAVWFQHNIPARRPLDILAAMTRAERILANSSLTALAQRRFNPRRVPVEVVRPGARIPGESRESLCARGRAALGIGSGAFVVAQVARLVPAKGHRTFLSAARSLCNARSDAVVVVAGEPLFDAVPGYAESLRRLAASLGIGERVIFTGNDVPAPLVLGAADVAVHVPEGIESYGLAVVEAMAAGAAVVAYDAGAVREIVEPGTSAVLVPPGEPEALATALLALHDDPEARRRLAETAYRIACERFDIRLVTRQVEAIYQRVVDGR